MLPKYKSEGQLKGLLSSNINAFLTFEKDIKLSLYHNQGFVTILYSFWTISRAKIMIFSFVERYEAGYSTRRSLKNVG